MQKREKSSIVYTLTVEDRVAFNLFHMRNSPAVRKTQREFIIKYSLLMFAVAFLMMSLLHKSVWVAFPVGLFTLFWTTAFLLYYQKVGYIGRLRKKLQRLDAEGKNAGLTGSHTFEVDEKGFVHGCDAGRTRFKWNDLVQIRNAPDYTYVYTSAEHAYIIPHKAIASGDFKAVMEQMGRHYQPDKKPAP